MFFLNFKRHNFLWISKPFSDEESSIYETDMAVKIGFPQLREDACLKTDLTEEADVST